MTNYTNIMENNYNLTALLSANPIEDPVTFIGRINEILGGYYVISFLIGLAVVLFLLMRRNETVEDSTAALFATFITAIIGSLIFVLPYITELQTKLLSGGQLGVIFVMLFISVVVDRIAIRYT